MTMTLKQALAFRLPNGKTMGEASPQEWKETAEVFRREAKDAENLDPDTMTEADRQRIQASLDRDLDFDQAIETIKEWLSKSGFPKF